MIPTPRTGRFLRAYLADGSDGIAREEVEIEVEGARREATFYRPERARRPLPGWVVLHGLTVPGRRHLAMSRFVRALAASGAAVLVPDVPAWRELRVETGEAPRTLRAGVEWLAGRPEVRAGGAGAVGFSFGATQVLMAAARPELAGAVRATVAFGGYCDLSRMVRALFTGEHEWEGVRYRFDPDPYGRWILAGNFLTRVPRLAGMAEAEQAALELAREAGRRGAYAWEGEYDAMKAELRAALPADQHAVWDAVAPPSGMPPSDTPFARALADDLAEAIRVHAPGLDPRGRLGGVRGRVVLSHGRADRLIPFTETLRLRTVLPPEADVSVTITGLFAHSTHAGLPSPLARLREAAVFVRLLNRALGAL